MKISQIIVDESIELGDNFDIELGNMVIESRVVGFMNDGVVVEADDKALALLGMGGALLESIDETKIVRTDHAAWTKEQNDHYFELHKQWYAAETPEARQKIKQQMFAVSKEYNADAEKHGRNKVFDYKESNEGVAEGDDDSFTKPAIIMRASPKAMAKAQSILQKQADKNVVSMAKIAGTVPSQGVAEDNMDEAKYQGRSVPLGKPMQGDVKKFKVYVKNKKGNVVKVNFGDPNMRIKKSNPARRKSFRARHRCATAKDRTSARYWSCRKW